jgi:murein DD-endopeptidase MepM/ murein hydrolase activator NlpD
VLSLPIMTDMTPLPRAGRLALLALALLVPLMATLPAGAHEDDDAYDPPDGDYMAVIDLTFPTDPDGTHFTDTYHAGRSGGRVHKATDIMGRKMMPIHAAMGGTIIRMPMVDDQYGYRITIRGDDGRTYSYVHLNNDTPGTDDDAAGPEYAYAPGLAQGDRVERGQHIGYMGDSGNAKGTTPHLHLSIADPDVTDPYGTDLLNPYPSLKAALTRGDVPTGEVHEAGGGACAAASDDGTFSDVPESSPHFSSVTYLAERGITEGRTPCRYEPASHVTRLQMASFVARMLEHHGVTLPANPRDHFDDDAGTVHEKRVNQLVEVGIITGDTGEVGRTFYGTISMKRDRMAAWIVRAHELMSGEALPDGESGRFSDVVAGRVDHAAEIEALAAAGVVEGFVDGTYRPRDGVRRDQMASYLARTLTLVGG